MQITIVVFDGFDELDVFAPYEVLRRATEMGADLNVILAQYTIWDINKRS
jgi:putative intracellular protease/amidase